MRRSSENHPILVRNHPIRGVARTSANRPKIIRLGGAIIRRSEEVS